MKNISGKRNELFSGLVAHVVINTKRKQFPTYLSAFIDHLVLDTQGIFEPVHIKRVERPEKLPDLIKEQVHPRVEENIYQFGFRLCTELEYDDYLEYVQNIMDSDLEPFIGGCHFEVSTPLYFSSVTKQYQGAISSKNGNTLRLYNVDWKSEFVLDMSTLLGRSLLDYETTRGMTIIPDLVTDDNQLIIKNILRLYDIKYSINDGTE